MTRGGVNKPATRVEQRGLTCAVGSDESGNPSQRSFETCPINRLDSPIGDGELANHKADPVRRRTGHRSCTGAGLDNDRRCDLRFCLRSRLPTAYAIQEGLDFDRGPGGELDIDRDREGRHAEQDVQVTRKAAQVDVPGKDGGENCADHRVPGITDLDDDHQHNELESTKGLERGWNPEVVEHPAQGTRHRRHGRRDAKNDDLQHAGRGTARFQCQL